MKTYIFIILLLVSNIAYSQNLYHTDFYTIKFISEDIKNKKEQFINEIKLQSFKKLLKSILIIEDYNLIKRNINHELVSNFIFSLDIKEEKIINNNYFSKIKIAFNYNKLINYFIENKYNFIAFKPEKFLIIIFDQDLLYEYILSKDNKFYEYLLKSNNDHSIFIIPNLDFNDRYLVTKEDFLEKKFRQYEELINKYDNQNIVIIHAVSSDDTIKTISYLNNNDKFKMVYKNNFQNQKYKIFFNQLEIIIIDEWKKNNLVITTNINKFECKINALNLFELKKIKDLINKNIIIKNMELKNISLKKNIYNFTYYGEFNILLKSLKKNKLKLEIFNEDCNLKLI